MAKKKVKSKVCPFCYGEGKLIIEDEMRKCKVCRGTGVV